MVSLADAYKQRDGAKRHKQVMIQMATPKHRPKRRQKQLRKAADARIDAATREGDAVVAKMQENLLSWKGMVYFQVYHACTFADPHTLLIKCFGIVQRLL